MVTGGIVFVFADKAIAFAQHDINRVAPAFAASDGGCGGAPPHYEKKGSGEIFFPSGCGQRPQRFF